MSSYDLHLSQVPGKTSLILCHMQELVHKTQSSPSTSKEQPPLPSNAETMLGEELSASGLSDFSYTLCQGQSRSLQTWT